MKRVPNTLGDGGSGLSRGQKIRTQTEDVYLADILSSVHAEVATVAAAQALGVDDRDGVILVRSTLFGLGRFRWDADSLANDTSGQLAIRPTSIDSGDPGRWVRDEAAFPIYVESTFSTANNAVLYTVPTGFRLQLISRPFATVTQSYASVGGASLGLSSSNSAYNTAGDLFGGATGSLSAALAAGIRAGTIGGKVSSQGLVVLVESDTIKYDLFTSTFEAGAAKFCLPVMSV